MPVKRFYTVKLGYTGVYAFFLFFAPKHRLWVLVRTEAVLTCTTIYVLSENKKKYIYIKNPLKIFIFTAEKNAVWACSSFRNENIN